MTEKRKNYKLGINQVRKNLGKLILVIAKHLFLDCLLIILLILLISAFFYYKYNILTQKKGLESFKNPFLLKQTDYQKVINIWQENEERFKEADSKEYINPFRESSKPAEEEE